MFIFFGTRSSHLKSTSLTASCSVCHTTGPHTVSIFGEYAHVFWIPVLPLSKPALVRCEHCLAIHDNKTAPPDLRTQLVRNTDAITAPTPGWHWVGSGLIGALIVFCVGLAFVGPSTKPGDEAGGQFSEFRKRRDENRTRTAYTNNPSAQTNALVSVSAPPDAARRALANDPRVGDTYVFETGNQRPRLTSVFTIKSVLAQSVETQWWVFRQDPDTGRDSLLSERKHEFTKVDLLHLEKLGTFRSIRRK